MDDSQKSLLIARILSGHIILPVDDRTFILKNPSPLQRYFAEQVYTETLSEAKQEGLFDTDEVLLKFIFNKKLWTPDEEKRILILPKDIEKFKEAMYNYRLQSDKVEGLRFHLNKAREGWEKLYSKRHSHDELTCQGQAILAKNKYLVGSSLCDKIGNPIFQHEDFWKDQSSLLDSAVNIYARLRLGENQLRELARTDPWRGIWASKSSTGGTVFDVSASELSDEQRSLVGWSNLYDSVHSHTQCPPESIIQDDDMLDGWLSIQRKKSDKDSNRNDIEGQITNNKIRNAQEVFILAGTQADANRIEELNDDVAKRTKQQRLRHLKEKGSVSEWNMPDTKQNMMMEFTKRGLVK